MGAVRFIAQDAAARWPVVQYAKPETILAIKKFTAKVFIKRCGFCKRLVITMNKNRDVALFLVLGLVILRKPICRGD